MNDNRIQIFALHQTHQGAERLRELAAAAPAARLVGLEGSIEEFEAKAVKLQPQLLLVELSGKINGMAEVLERLRREVPSGAVMALAQSRDPDDIIAAMRLGVREYLTEPTPPAAFNDAVLRLLRQNAARGGAAGSLLAVMGVKGGVGASLVALNLAWCFSRDPKLSVALVDLDLQAGELAVLLDQEPERDLSEAAVNFERLDAAFMAGLLLEVSPGLRLLPAPTDPATAEDVHPKHVMHALDYLCDAHGLVVVDLPSRLDEAGLMALDRADAILLVLEPSLLGLAAAKRLISLFERLGHSAEKRRLAVNRHGIKGGLGRAEIERVLGVRAEALLPDDSRLILQAVNSGRPVCRQWPRAKWSRRLAALAESLASSLVAPREKAEP